MRSFAAALLAVVFVCCGASVGFQTPCDNPEETDCGEVLEVQVSLLQSSAAVSSRANPGPLVEHEQLHDEDVVDVIEDQAMVDGIVDESRGNSEYAPSSGANEGASLEALYDALLNEYHQLSMSRSTLTQGSAGNPFENNNTNNNTNTGPRRFVSRTGAGHIPHEEMRLLLENMTQVVKVMLPLIVMAVIAFEIYHRTWADTDFNTEAPLPSVEESRTQISTFLRGTSTLVSPYLCTSAGSKGRIYVAVKLALASFGLFLGLVHLAWSKQFWDAIQDKMQNDFYILLRMFVAIVLTFILLDVYQGYLGQMLYINWREAMTKRYVRAWLSGNAFYTIQLNHDQREKVENPDQRIQEDVSAFVGLTSTLGFDGFNAVGHILVYVPLVWYLSPTLAFGRYYCPGWLIYMALAYAIIGTFSTHAIAKKLVPIDFARQRYEADFRYGLMQSREYAEQIVLSRGERTEEQGLDRKFERIKVMWWTYMAITKRLAYFRSCFGFIKGILPIMIIAPSYFNDEISLGTLFQLTEALGTVQGSFDTIMNHFTTLTEWRAVSDRLLGFHKAMVEAHKSVGDSKVERHVGVPEKHIEGVSPDKMGVAVEGLSLSLPDGKPLWENVSFAVAAGEKVLFVGKEGTGKSTLFRALAGAWPYVTNGNVWCLPDDSVDVKAQTKINSDEKEQGQDFNSDGLVVSDLPVAARNANGRKVMFVPQKAYFPAFCSLRGALAYPESAETYDDAAYMKVLHDVKLEKILTSEEALEGASVAGQTKEQLISGGFGLDREAKWSMVLSAGQQQRMAFARVLLNHPDMVFLDEATSSVSQESAKELYELVQDRLGPKTTLVSIYTDGTLAHLHDRTVRVEAENNICKGLVTVKGQ